MLKIIDYLLNNKMLYHKTHLHNMMMILLINKFKLRTNFIILIITIISLIKIDNIDHTKIITLPLTILIVKLIISAIII
jgi:hypothetical protein